MIKKPFFSIGTPKPQYPVINDLNPGFEEGIPLPEVVTVYLNKPYSPAIEGFLKIGDSLKTGQKMTFDNEGSYFLSPATGSVCALDGFIGYLGVKYTSVSIKTNPEEQEDDSIKTLIGNASVENASDYLAMLPGCPDFKSFINRKYPFDTIIVEGADDDLLVSASQAVIEEYSNELLEGIKILKDLAGVKNVYVTAFPASAQKLKNSGVSVIELEPVYPAALPQMITRKRFKRIVPAGQRCEDIGVGFIRAEAVVALGLAFNKGEAPVKKIITVIDKTGSVKNLKVRIGTPVKDILDFLSIKTAHGDRIVMGGPLRGKSIYSENTPVLWDTDAILVQSGEKIAQSQDNPCINCGECVRACPANVPVNMLIRLLENGLYEEAAREYDLLSCIECGLCSYVCVARIPVFHYIMLGKNEYLKLRSMEDTNA
ncbi:MAG: 4Fe-4S dicluster domain-containing protein [Deltaproteobacteria bacterium]|nr:4Fe-4S dicluster domain-containing protein [Deltaproteobacteria bacterium]